MFGGIANSYPNIYEQQQLIGINRKKIREMQSAIGLQGVSLAQLGTATKPQPLEVKPDLKLLLIED